MRRPRPVPALLPCGRPGVSCMHVFVVPTHAQAAVLATMHEAFEKSKTYKPEETVLADNWADIVLPTTAIPAQETGVSLPVLKQARLLSSEGGGELTGFSPSSR